MIVYLANKTQFRDDILSNRIEEIVHDSFKGVLGKTVGASERIVKDGSSTSSPVSVESPCAFLAA